MVAYAQACEAGAVASNPPSNDMKQRPKKVLGKCRDWYHDPFRRRATWTEITTVLLTAAIIYTAWAQTYFMSQSVRPWIAFDVTSKDEGIGIDNDFAPFKVASDGKTASIGLHYWLSNTGRYPTNIRINGEILDETVEQVQDPNFEPNEAQRLCDEEKRVFTQKAKRWSVVPGIPMPYGFTYDGELSKENHLPAINLRIADPSNSQPHDLTNLGCIVYQSSEWGFSKLRQTPFLAKIKIRVGGPSIDEARGLLIIGEPN